MIKEIKYFFYVFTIILFIFLSLKYYFSDEHKKKSYRLIQIIDKDLKTYSEEIPVLKSDTEETVEYVKNINNVNKKKYHFWELLFDNEE